MHPSMTSPSITLEVPAFACRTQTPREMPLNRAANTKIHNEPNFTRPSLGFLRSGLQKNRHYPVIDGGLTARNKPPIERSRRLVIEDITAQMQRGTASATGGHQPRDLEVQI
jgi:hypothetical protein